MTTNKTNKNSRKNTNRTNGAPVYNKPRVPKEPRPRPLDEERDEQLYDRPSGQEEVGNGAVIGRNAVRELLRSERTVDKLLVRRGDREGSIVALIAQAKDRGIPVIEVDRKKLDEMAGTSPHQGIIALAAEKDYVEPEDILRIAEERGEPPLIAIADGIADPYNLGALIRCAEGLGAHGLIIPKRRAVGLTPLVTKASAGAVEHLAVAKVTNLAQTVRMLQERGVWVYAAEAGGTDYDKTNFRGPCALIFGSEGQGVSALLKERCDGIVSIPMKGRVNSFNVSTAAAILLAEAARQHREAAAACENA
jgi:23S rRNA (guanosine2251-2'-O)-methyltransferase